MRQVTDLREIQGLAVNILKGINEFCFENHITYYMGYGTLLGAIRHNGFIPWDDDIDLWMKREDFNIFCESFPLWGADRGFYLNSLRTVSNYNRVQAKVCLCNTVLTEDDRLNPFKEGYFVDIFPIDGTPNNTLLRSIHMTRLQILKNIVTLSAYNREAKSITAIIAKLFKHVDAHKVLCRREKIAEKYTCDNSEYFQMLSPGNNHGRDILIAAKNFSGCLEWAFEDTFAMLPSGYDAILSGIYGDYMQLPPKEKQKPHHYYRLYIEE